MFDVTNLLGLSPYDMPSGRKRELFEGALRDLTEWHYEQCSQYRKILDFLGFEISKAKGIADYPFIPVRLFKDYELMSITRDKVFKTLTSSGTTGQKVSKIYLDKATSMNQTKALVRIMSSFMGNKRLPMLIVDSPAVLKDRDQFSARGAGILGFSMLGYDQTYALNENMDLDLDVVQRFQAKHKGEPILIFGFTFMIWKYLHDTLVVKNLKLNFDGGILLHGGGWKKLAGESVDSDLFKKSLEEVCGVTRVHDYYGMVEQTGSICMECEKGFLHTSMFSDILFRDHKDFAVLPEGTTGLVQLISLLPMSYPGHSILTEDLGELVGEDSCSCGRKGKYFKIHGRVKNAEIRGCSDTHAFSN